MEKSSLHILFASRLVEEKWVRILIETIQRSTDPSYSGSPIIWHIASDGVYESEIISLMTRFPWWVIYHGKIDHKKLANLYRESDALFMPSLFLETFGLTALEAVASGVPVIGFRKGWLIEFIPRELALDEESPVDSFFEIIGSSLLPVSEVSKFSSWTWTEKLRILFPTDNIALIHDYRDRIGWAEYYVEMLLSSFPRVGKRVSWYSYAGKTSPWKRKLLFVLSLFAFWRYFAVRDFLHNQNPWAIWMHSVIRYVWVWGLLAIRHYALSRATHVSLSHHDVGWIAPFPQHVMSEDDIPISPSLSDFLSRTRGFSRLVALGKWWYLALYKKILPKNTRHIVFAPFLERHIHAHFGQCEVQAFPHTYDETVFHP